MQKQNLIEVLALLKQAVAEIKEEAAQDGRSFSDSEGEFKNHPETYHLDHLTHHWVLNLGRNNVHSEAPSLFQMPKPIHKEEDEWVAKRAEEMGFTRKEDDHTSFQMPSLESQAKLYENEHPPGSKDSEEELNRNLRHFGHLTSYLIGNQEGLVKMHPNELSKIDPDTAEDAAYREGFQHGAKKLMAQQELPENHYGHELAKTLSKAEIQQVSDHFIKPQSSVLKDLGLPIKTPVDDDSLDQWLDHKGMGVSYHGSSPNEVKAAYHYAVNNGVPEDLAREWADDRHSDWDANGPDDYDSLDDWADSEHGGVHDVQTFIHIAHEAESLGASSSKLADWISEKLNNNVSEGGLVDDSRYAARRYDPEKASNDAVKWLNEFASGNHEGDDPAPQFQSAQEALMHPLARKELSEELRQVADAGEREGHQNWSAAGVKTARAAIVLGDIQGSARMSAADPDAHVGVEKFYKDMGRYIDQTGKEPRYVLGDDATPWLSDDEYRFTQYDTVPHSDGSTRVQREDTMGIGRVNYAALGFEAPHVPVVRFSGVINAPHSVVVDELRHPAAEYADFNVRGYGKNTFFFDGVKDDKPSHAVDDTYYDPSYCSQGGVNSLIPNAVSFARGQMDYRRLVRPDSDSWAYGPNFLELHPGSLVPSQRLRRVNITADPHVLKDKVGLDYNFVTDVLHHSSADIHVHLERPEFYPSDMKLASGKMIGDYLPGDISEKQAIDNIDRYRELLESSTAARFDSDEAQRVKLHLPYWYRERTGNKS